MSPNFPRSHGLQETQGGSVCADAGQPIRARDLCQALDLPIAPWNTENIRSKLKRLASRGILIETEPGFGLASNALNSANTYWSLWCLQLSSDHDCPCVTVVSRSLSHADRTPRLRAFRIEGECQSGPLGWQ
jgi:hypothetical protein